MAPRLRLPTASPPQSPSYEPITHPTLYAATHATIHLPDAHTCCHLCATPAYATLVPAPRLPCHHRLIARRIRTGEACRLVSATPPPPSLLACAISRCDSATSRLLEPATLRHPVTLCDSAPTPSVLRSRRPTRTACHLSPPTRGEPSQSFPAPCSAE